MSDYQPVPVECLFARTDDRDVCILVRANGTTYRAIDVKGHSCLYNDVLYEPVQSWTDEDGRRTRVLLEKVR